MLPFATGTLDNTLDSTVDGVLENTNALPEPLRPWIVIGIGLLAAAVIATVVSLVVARTLRSKPELAKDAARGRMPLWWALNFAFTKISLAITVADSQWIRLWQFMLLLGLVLSLAWLVTVLLGLLEDMVLAKYRTDLENPRRLAKMQTQVGLLRRVATVLVMVLAVAGTLLTIPEVRALGAGLLASAGLISVVAALAVQSSLANVFAGLQIAFTDAIRVNDTVVVETQRGNIEEITLTYVVVVLLDGRRMIIPSTYFTTTPFENWSRRTTEINGSVLLDLGWNAPIEHLRTRTEQLLASTDLWDGRVGSLNVTDAIGGILKVTIAVSARNPGDLFDLKNYVREHLIAELHRDYPDVLPQPMVPGTPAV
ncbi:mechanosensitive ion channel family protein [Paeniglutamicibacter sp. NPDC012692]|uniref:mechanosensitive ion channel family protein n=1 Tax=Paeniglutamicibacter sp. NPDC012692 TaxID=3364388 RepID=UPI0036AF47C7